MKDHPLIEHFTHSDRVMLYINYGLTVASLGLASWYNTWLEAIFIGGGTSVALTAMYSLAKGSPICRVAMASGFMVLTALHIHQAHGMIEFHFGVFALLAMLLFYRDWLPVLAAATVIAVHHLSFYFIQASGADIWVLPATDKGIGIILLHALYVVIETALLLWFSLMLKREALQSAEIMNTTNLILESDKIDLTQRTSGNTNLLSKFNDFTSDIETLSQQVHTSSVRLNNQGDDLNAITAQLQSAAHSQQNETDLIATAVEEMSAAIFEVTRNAELAAEASSQIDKNANEATLVSQETQCNVKDLAIKVSEAVHTIESLNEHAHNIGSVLGVIRGIAEQTNLLALNAAIEAARAGDQGRGFAVVADEVRTLALRTQQSTQEIDNMIELLQNGSAKAVKAIESSREQANDCVANTVNALEIMESVSIAIREISQMNTMIATSASEQSIVTGEISRNVSNILNASRDTAENTNGAAGSAQAMQDIARELAQTTTRFIVS